MPDRPHAPPGILGSSPGLRRVLAQVARYAPTDHTVLITGETGTGKELIARAVHAQSGRAGELVPVSCANLSVELFDSELFGHEKGSFTGASGHSRGLAVAASRGTLFLDEVGELPLPLQAKLLRFLQERTVRPVGSQAERPVDVRIVAATHRDLAAMVAAGSFREDLLYRLDALRLHLPPLRDRGEDLVAIARHVVAGFEHERGIGHRVLTRSAEAALRAHTWPGNVRDLRRVLNRLALATTRADGAITGAMVRAELQVDARPKTPEAAILTLLADAGSATIVDLARVARMPRKSAQRWARTLVEKGAITMTGRSTGTRYHLPAPKVAEPPARPSADDARWEAALAVLARDGRVTRQSLAERSGTSERTATRLLAEMAARGLLHREGATGRWCAYVRPPQGETQP